MEWENDQEWSESDDDDLSNQNINNAILERNYDYIFDIRNKLNQLTKLERVETSKLFRKSEIEFRNDTEESNTEMLAFMTCLGRDLSNLWPADIMIRKMIWWFSIHNSSKLLQVCFDYLSLDPNMIDEQGNHILHFVSTVEIAKILRLSNADLFHSNNEGITPIHRAAERNLGRLASYFISFASNQREEINRMDNFGNSTIFFVCFKFINLINELEVNLADLIQLNIMAQSFIYGGADLDVTNNDGQRAKDIILKVSVN